MREVIAAAQLALASLGALLLAWQVWLERRGRPTAARVARDRALAALGALGLCAYVNFGRMHQGRFVHVWDTYHYYVGARYFPELGYDLLYGCTAVADAEAGLRREVATRTMTDLSTNLPVRTFDFLRHPDVIAIDPLHVAIDVRGLGVSGAEVKALLDAGACPWALDIELRAPWHVARQNGDRQADELRLEARGWRRHA